MTITLRQYAETAKEPRDALRAFVADVGPVTEQDALAFLRGEPKRLRKYLADLQHEGSIGRNQAGAFVFLGWHALALRRYPGAAQSPIAFADDLVNAMGGRAPAPSGGAARAPDVSKIGSSRIDPDPSYSTRLDLEPRTSSRSYIEEKLCLPKLTRLRIEVTGANTHMARKFVAMLQRDPDKLAEWIGEAATPAITQPCQFLNVRMTDYLRSELRL